MTSNPISEQLLGTPPATLWPARPGDPSSGTQDRVGAEGRRMQLRWSRCTEPQGPTQTKAAQPLPPPASPYQEVTCPREHPLPCLGATEGQEVALALWHSCKSILLLRTEQSSRSLCSSDEQRAPGEQFQPLHVEGNFTCRYTST